MCNCGWAIPTGHGGLAKLTLDRAPACRVRASIDVHLGRECLLDSAPITLYREKTGFCLVDLSKADQWAAVPRRRRPRHHSDGPVEGSVERTAARVRMVKAMSARGWHAVGVETLLLCLLGRVSASSRTACPIRSGTSPSHPPSACRPQRMASGRAAVRFVHEDPYLYVCKTLSNLPTSTGRVAAASKKRKGGGE
jgi:hypothetical protein